MLVIRNLRIRLFSQRDVVIKNLLHSTKKSNIISNNQHISGKNFRCNFSLLKIMFFFAITFTSSFITIVITTTKAAWWSLNQLEADGGVQDSILYLPLHQASGSAFATGYSTVQNTTYPLYSVTQLEHINLKQYGALNQTFRGNTNIYKLQKTAICASLLANACFLSKTSRKAEQKS